MRAFNRYGSHSHSYLQMPNLLSLSTFAVFIMALTMQRQANRDNIRLSVYRFVPLHRFSPIFTRIDLLLLPWEKPAPQHHPPPPNKKNPELLLSSSNSKFFRYCVCLNHFPSFSTAVVVPVLLNIAHDPRNAGQTIWDLSGIFTRETLYCRSLVSQEVLDQDHWQAGDGIGLADVAFKVETRLASAPGEGGGEDTRRTR